MRDQRGKEEDEKPGRGLRCQFENVCGHLSSQLISVSFWHNISIINTRVFHCSFQFLVRRDITPNSLLTRSTQLEQELKEVGGRKRKLEEEITFLNSECTRLADLEEDRVADVNQGKKEANELKVRHIME